MRRKWRSHTRQPTYDPKEPALHFVDRYHISGIQYEVWKYGHGHPKRCMVAAEKQPNCTEEALHCQESGIIYKVKREKSACRALKVRHEVDYDVEYENSRG